MTKPESRQNYQQRKLSDLHERADSLIIGKKNSIDFLRKYRKNITQGNRSEKIKNIAENAIDDIISYFRNAGKIEISKHVKEEFNDRYDIFKERYSILREYESFAQRATEHGKLLANYDIKYLKDDKYFDALDKQSEISRGNLIDTLTTEEQNLYEEAIIAEEEMKKRIHILLEELEPLDKRIQQYNQDVDDYNKIFPNENKLLKLPDRMHWGHYAYESIIENDNIPFPFHEMVDRGLMQEYERFPSYETSFDTTWDRLILRDERLDIRGGNDIDPDYIFFTKNAKHIGQLQAVVDKYNNKYNELISKENLDITERNLLNLFKSAKKEKDMLEPVLLATIDPLNKKIEALNSKIDRYNYRVSSDKKLLKLLDADHWKNVGYSSTHNDNSSLYTHVRQRDLSQYEDPKDYM